MGEGCICCERDRKRKFLLKRGWVELLQGELEFWSSGGIVTGGDVFTGPSTTLDLAYQQAMAKETPRPFYYPPG